MGHAMANQTGTGAHRLWSISRWLASGLERRGEYKRTMDLADMPRQGDLDGRGNLSLKALQDFVLWFLSCLDQVQFVSGPFDLNELQQRFLISVERSSSKTSSCCASGRSAHGEFERKEVACITGLPGSTARRMLGT